MGMPTDQDRELWRKATQTPSQITEEERRSILGLVDLATQITNAFKISGMTPEELENKALTNPESLTQPECQLIKHGYHIWNHQESMENSHMDWPLADKMASISACVALHTSHENAVRLAVSRRTDFFFEERRKASKLRMAKVAENIDTPCTWVRRLIDPSVPILQQTRRWGFIAFRDASTECTNEVWEKFLRQLDEYAYVRGLLMMTGGPTINQTKQLIFRDGFADSDRASLCSTFQNAMPASDTANTHILSNTFLLIDSDVMASFGGDNSSNPWIWAYEANFVPSADPAIADLDGGKKYDGRLKVALNTLFTWFYGARKEEIHSMERFWELAQRQPGQAWTVGTSMGRYHGPLVLVEKGSMWPFNSYELEDEA